MNATFFAPHPAAPIPGLQVPGHPPNMLPGHPLLPQTMVRRFHLPQPFPGFVFVEDKAHGEWKGGQALPPPISCGPQHCSGRKKPPQPSPHSPQTARPLRGYHRPHRVRGSSRISQQHRELRTPVASTLVQPLVETEWGWGTTLAMMQREDTQGGIHLSLGFQNLTASEEARFDHHFPDPRRLLLDVANSKEQKPGGLILPGKASGRGKPEPGYEPAERTISTVGQNEISASHLGRRT
nr:uncharacterized protein LOC116148470 isoform X2 [Camelus dromedarius]